MTPEVLARFRADLEAAGVGRHAVRVSLVIVQAMFSRAQSWGWVTSNPALVFARRDGAPWRITDVNNWRRRVWHPAREHAGLEVLPPYHLRHAFASLQIRAGTSIPELAEQMGHSPQMTLGRRTPT